MNPYMILGQNAANSESGLASVQRTSSNLDHVITRRAYTSVTAIEKWAGRFRNLVRHAA